MSRQARLLDRACSWEQGVERTDQENEGEGDRWDPGGKEREVKIREFLAGVG